MEEYKKQLYDATLITIGATAVGLASKKAVGAPLGTPETLKGALIIRHCSGVGMYSSEVRRKEEMDSV